MNRAKITQVAQRLQTEITDPRNVGRESYLAPAQQLYQWMVQPVEEVLKAKKIDTILFCTGPGLRALPMAALHDGQQFLVEKYSPVRIPAFNLINLSQTNLKQARVLAMGASEFAQQTPLPAVPVELETIVQSNNLATQQPTPIVANQWPGRSFLNQSFTLNNLTAQVASDDFGIVHLATHAEFQPGAPENSYIQLWDEKLRLDQVNQIGWDNPPMELLVLSACRTAIGDREVELGFAGLALYSGVKSALASLWYVSDTGTLALMSEFYQQLRTAPTKSAALQKAQIAMLSGKVRVEKGELLSSRGEVALPPDLAGSSTTNLSHPFYWAGFNLIGTPW
ncbi:MAG: CHAT domain-containing protein [Microcoleaceae cyanobacterium]